MNIQIMNYEISLRISEYILLASLCVLIACGVLTGPAHAAQGLSQKNLEAHDGKGKRMRSRIEHEGMDRRYLLYIPESIDKQVASPLVMVFHGGFGSGERIANRIGMDAIAAKNGFIVVYPDGVDRHWNDGRDTTSAGADDVSFVRALIKEIASHFNIDKQRIYATGLSNGGYLTQRLACELSGTFAAFASVIATMPIPLDERCMPRHPVAMMMINGTDDPLVPWEGGALSRGKRMGGKGGTVLSVPATFEYWRKHNNCMTEQKRVTLPDLDPADRTIVTKSEYVDCRQGVNVILLSVIGGGHSWPGASTARKRTKLTGNISNDINASAVIWDFFSQHSLAQPVSEY